jgi:lambda family phage portal protein
MNLIARTRLAIRGAFDAWSLGPGGSSVSLTAWDASKAGAQLSRWVPPSTDFSTNLTPALLKRRARDAYRNFSWARRAIDVLVSYVISTGVVPRIDVPDSALRQRVATFWTKWTDSADFEGLFDTYGLQASAFRAALVDGESLTLIRPGNPLQLQVLSAEFLDWSRDNARDILGGIQFDTEGRRIGYWLYDKAPAAALVPISKFVPADRVIHLFAPLQPGFQRGTSWLAPGLLSLYQLEEYTSAALVNAKVKNLTSGFIRTPDGSPTANGQQSYVTFEPGSIATLGPGQDIEFFNPNDTSNSFDPFVRSQLRSIASALGISYELLSGDYSGVTYASGRAGQQGFKRLTDSIVHNLFAFQWCRPVWSWWTRTMIALGELPDEVLDAPVNWIPVPVEMLDRRAEVESTRAAIRAGLTSRAAVVSESGIDPIALDEQIAQDNARADRLNLVFDSDPRKVTQQGLEQPQAAPQEGVAA